MKATVPNSPKEIARSLADELRSAAVRAGPVVGSGGLTEALAAKLSDRFLDRHSPDARLAGRERSSVAYWRDHGRVTGKLMVEFCKSRGPGADTSLYRRVGELHDVDYLAFPHDVGAVDGPVHPAPLVKAMAEAGVHPTVCLAVLEHAPYVGLDRTPSSRLAAALSACEDIATLASLSPAPPDVFAALSPAAAELLSRAEPCERLSRDAQLRVEKDIARYVNEPLRKASSGGEFELQA